MLRAIKGRSRPIRFSVNAAIHQRTKRLWPLAVSVTAGPPNTNLSNFPVPVTTSYQGQEVPIEENGKGRNNTQIRHEETRDTRASLSKLDWSDEEGEGEAPVITRAAAIDTPGGEATSSSSPKRSLRPQPKSVCESLFAPQQVLTSQQESTPQRPPSYPPGENSFHQSSELSRNQQQLASQELPVSQPLPHTSKQLPPYTDDQLMPAPLPVVRGRKSSYGCFRRPPPSFEPFYNVEPVPGPSRVSNLVQHSTAQHSLLSSQITPPLRPPPCEPATTAMRPRTLSIAPTCNCRTRKLHIWPTTKLSSHNQVQRRSGMETRHKDVIN